MASPDDSHLERLHHAANQLYSSDSTQECYEIVVETAVDLLGFEWSVLAKPAPNGETFLVMAASDSAPVDVGDRTVSLEDSVAGEVYRTNETDVTNAVHESDRGEPVSPDLRSGLTVPVGDWGIYQAVSTEPNAYSDGDRRRAELLMSHAATAIERLETEAELRERSRELAARNERLDEVTTIISHDLRSPLNVAQGCLEMARQDCSSPYLDDVATAHDRMATLIEGMLTWAREGELLEEMATVSLAAVARDAVTGVADEIDLRIETDAIVWTDEARLRQLFGNLFRNAVDHGTGEPTVTVGDLADGFFVADDGPGIDPEDRETVFETGFTTSEDGTGFGLAIVEAIADANGWTVAVTESAEGGARFEFSGVDCSGE